ncbi:MAG: outer membrane beta-barrel protein [Gemmatimonadota bacterium]|nr:outer membrane beta-barrel protein [Gemmatimonadota bacterium]
MRSPLSVAAPMLAALLLAATSVPAFAQRPPVEREGFWISFGFGGGWADDDAFEDGEAGSVGFVRLGGSPSRNLVIGGEIIGWANDDDPTALADTEVSRGNLQFVALYYPGGESGLFLKGGAGAAVRTVETDFGDDTTLTRDSGGVGLDAGIGWDIRLARNFFLTPTLDVLYQFLENDDSAAAILFTVGATWH